VAALHLVGRFHSYVLAQFVILLLQFLEAAAELGHGCVEAAA